MKSFEELAKSRQSCRDFIKKEVEKEKLDKIIETALLAPSARNAQPWKLYLVTSQDKVSEVTGCLQGAARNKFLSEVPCYIVVADRPSYKQDANGQNVLVENRFTKYDVGEIAAYITLVAEDMGIASCIIGWIDIASLRKAVGMGEDENYNMVIALGYTNCELRQKTRLKKEELVIEL